MKNTKKKDSRGGKRDNSGRKAKDDPLNTIERLRAEVWFRQLTHEAGSIPKISKLFENASTIEKICSNFSINENERALPSKSRLYDYESNGAIPRDKYINRIGFLFPETLFVWKKKGFIWEAIEKRDAFLENIGAKYIRDTTVNTGLISLEEYNEACEHFTTLEQILEDDLISEKNYSYLLNQKELGENTIEIDYADIPSFIYKKLSNDLFFKSDRRYLRMKDNFLEENLEYLDCFDVKVEGTELDEARYNLIQQQIRLYVDYELISPQEGFCDILSIDIAIRRNNYSLSDNEISNLPIGIQAVYKKLPEEIQKYDNANANVNVPQLLEVKH